MLIMTSGVWLTVGEFVRAWTDASSLDDFCNKTRYERANANARAFAIRVKHKIPLKHFQPRTFRLSEVMLEELRDTVKQNRPLVPPRGFPDLIQFVKVWQSSPSVTAICQRLNVKHGAAVQMAARMRRHGIELKPFARRGWNNSLLRELGRYARTVGQPAHFVVGPMQRRIAYLEEQVAKLEKQLRAR